MERSQKEKNQRINRLKVLILFVSLTFGLNLFSQTVYTTKTGEKYHKSSCHYLKHSKKAIKLDKAKAYGYQPCKICKPTASNTKDKSSSLTSKQKKQNQPSTTKKTTATQCTGKTKSGKRCKRKTKNANRRCYQH